MAEPIIHWNNIYSTKNQNEVSWTQAIPELSLTILNNLHLDKNSPIIDIGGGDSNLVDYLINLGYTDITVLDISKVAINKAKARLGNLANKVNWIVTDILNFEPTKQYQFWHDRAAFHFLTKPEEIATYLKLTNNFTTDDGYLCIGTFSTNGPTKCSGLEIKQYNELSLANIFGNDFNLTEYFYQNHQTPFNTMQNFIFGVFKRKLA